VSMTVDEFIALKTEVRCRAVQALSTLGQVVVVNPDGGGPKVFTYPGLSVVGVPGTFRVSLDVLKQGLVAVYEEHRGEEQTLAHSHVALVFHYNRALELLNRALVLEDLADV
jgi:hypothetical protein